MSTSLRRNKGTFQIGLGGGRGSDRKTGSELLTHGEGECIERGRKMTTQSRVVLVRTVDVQLSPSTSSSFGRSAFPQCPQLSLVYSPTSFQVAREEFDHFFPHDATLLPPALILDDLSLWISGLWNLGLTTIFLIPGLVFSARAGLLYYCIHYMGPQSFSA